MCVSFTEEENVWRGIKETFSTIWSNDREIPERERRVCGHLFEFLIKGSSVFNEYIELPHLNFL